MRSIALVAERREAELRNIPAFEATVHGTVLPFSVLDVSRPHFDSSDVKNSGKVLVRVEAFSCNYRDAALLLLGHSLLRASKVPGLVHFGSDFAGVVEAVGGEVHNIELGQRVMPNASYPQDREPIQGDGVPSNRVSRGWLILAASKLCPVPEGVGPVVAAALGLNTQTAASLVRRAGIRPGSRVLITAGRSNTSLCVAGLASAVGAECTVLSTRSWTQLELNAAANPTVLPVVADPTPFTTRPIKALLHQGKTFDAIIDPFFDLYSMRVLPHLAHGGTYVTCGLKNQHDAQRELSDLEDVQVSVTQMYSIFSSLMIGNRSIIGNCIGLEEDLDFALKNVATGKFSPVIDSVHGVDESDIFMRRSFGAEARFGKSILDLRTNSRRSESLGSDEILSWRGAIS